jgi:hypothetical protein
MFEQNRVGGGLVGFRSPQDSDERSSSYLDGHAWFAGEHLANRIYYFYLNTPVL